MLRMMGFPGRYLQGPNALAVLGALIKEMGLQRPVTLCDAVVAERVWPTAATSLKGVGFQSLRLMFPGECTSVAIAALSDDARAHQPDVIIGLGGGKTIDSAKGIARTLGTAVIICPTIASNDAPTSRLIVLYDESHRVAGVEYLNCSPAAVVVDTQVIAQAPARFFAAGIGDAISKKFEARQCQRAAGNNSYGTPPLNTALMMADSVYETILRHGVSAYQTVSEGRLDDEVELVVEGTVLLSGIGFESGGLSLVHALIRGLTAVPTMAAMLHGELVAFGTLVQLVVEGRPESEVQELVTLLRAVNLPVSFAHLGQSQPLNLKEMETIVQATLAAPYSRNMKPALTAERLGDALLTADRIGTALISLNA